MASSAAIWISDGILRVSPLSFPPHWNAYAFEYLNKFGDVAIRWITELLNGARIFVVEDQPFIALDLALAVEDADGEVVGPAAGVKEALGLLAGRSIAGAILDVNLVDGDCSPVVEILAGLNVPIILQTGVGLPPGLADRFPNLAVHIKPCVAAHLVAQLEAMIADRVATNTAR